MLPCGQAHMVAGFVAPGRHRARRRSGRRPVGSGGPVPPRAGMERLVRSGPRRYGAPVRSHTSRLRPHCPVPPGGAKPARRGGTMSDGDLMFRGALELAAMVRSGEVSARELTELSLERIEELNPSLNAFVEVDG